MIAIEELKFDEKGLIPAVVQDIETGRVLTLAYMNRESLEISLEEGSFVPVKALNELRRSAAGRLRAKLLGKGTG